jgi:hypothetical protein
MIRQLRSTLCALAICASTAAYAHVVWIEVKGNQLVVRFAEPGDSFETSPGYLDSLLSPMAFIVAANDAPASVETSKTACVETSFTVRGGRKPIFYARWQPAKAGAATPLLTLDLVPTGKEGEVRAYFRGKPLGGIAATLRRPDEKDQELSADADGFLHFESKQAGPYLLIIAHYREALAGFHAGQPYQETSHNCSLAWRQP